MKLYNHQIDFLNQKVDKSALIWSCGTGKSRTAIEWAKQSDVNTIIVCPKALKANWENEKIKWGLQNADVVSKEEFKKAKLSKYGQIIVDEVHNGFLTPMFKSQMSKTLRKFIKDNQPRVLLLSATVYSSSPWNIYNLAHYLGRDWNWKNFSDAFFDQIRMGARVIPVAKKGCEERLSNAVKKFASIVDIKDCMDIPLQNHLEPEYFSLSKEQLKAIDENFDPLPIVRYTRQHEIEQGVLIGTEFTDDSFYDCDKNNRLLDIVTENPKVAIIARYNLQIDKIKELLKDYSPLVIRGDVKNRHEITLQAEQSQRCVVLIQADCAEGYQLPSFPLCVFMSMSYSYVKYEQLLGRFLRMDKPSKTTFMYLFIEGESMDNAVFNSVKLKEDFNINLYGKNRS